MTTNGRGAGGAAGAAATEQPARSEVSEETGSRMGSRLNAETEAALQSLRALDAEPEPVGRSWTDLIELDLGRLIGVEGLIGGTVLA